MQQHKELLDLLAGCVYDSAPCLPTPWVGAHAASQLAGGKLARFLTAVSMYGKAMLGRVYALLGAWDGEAGRPWHWIKDFMEQPCRCPEMFVYSEDDPICPVSALETFIAGRRKQGTTVSEASCDSWLPNCHPHMQCERLSRPM